MLCGVMHRSRRSLFIVAGLLGALVIVPGTHGATYEVHVCDGPASSVLTEDGGWSSLITGSDVVLDGGWGQVPTQAPLTCNASLNSRNSLPGLGIHQGTAAPGSVATRSYTPAAGHRIIGLRGKVIASSGLYSFSRGFLSTAAGRNLVDTGATTSGDFGEVPSTLDLGADAIGADGQRGLTWGVRCPDQLPAPEDARGYCRGGIFSLRATMTIDDGQPVPAPIETPEPTPTPTPTPIPAEARPITVPLASGPSAPRPAVSITARARRSAVVLSGRALNCSVVKVDLPNGRRVTAGVSKGAWRTMVHRRSGRYLVTCSTASASLTLRR